MLLAAIALAAPLSAAPGGRLVLAPSGLHLREGPGVEAPVLETLPFGAEVAPLGEPAAPQREAIESVDGVWVPVQAPSGQTGFVFDGFLSRWPAAPEGCESLDDYAALLGEVVKESFRVLDDCECPDRALRTTWTWGDGAELVAIEGQRTVSLALSLPGVTALERRRIATACGSELDLRQQIAR